MGKQQRQAKAKALLDSIGFVRIGYREREGRPKARDDRKGGQFNGKPRSPSRKLRRLRHRCGR